MPRRRATRRSGSSDKIFVIMAVDGSGGSIKTSHGEQAELSSAFPEAARLAAYVGRYGWVDVEFAGHPRRGPDARSSTGAWARTAPEEAGRGLAGRPMTTIRATLADASRAPTIRRGTAHRGGLRPRPRRGSGRAHPVRRGRLPGRRDERDIALAAADAGADLLEIGLPYSDPLADGATLQRASQVALAAGANLEGSLRLIERIGAARPDLPIVPDGLRQPGHRRRRRRGGRPAARRGRRGRAHRGRPDAGRGRRRSRRSPATAGLAVVYLVAPTTPPERRAAIAARSGGFLYCVSLVGVTGARADLPTSVGALVRDVRAASPVPVGVGFGVSQPEHVRGHRRGRRRRGHRGQRPGRRARRRTAATSTLLADLVRSLRAAT